MTKPAAVEQILRDLAHVDPHEPRVVQELKARAAALLERPLSTGEVAELLGVSTSTITAWADSGELRCTRTRGHHRRFDRAALRRYLTQRKRPIPESLRAPAGVKA
jgi:excisionase family DNA binding protein